MTSSSLYEHYCKLISQYEKICEDNASRHDKLSYERSFNILSDLKESFKRLFGRSFNKSDTLVVA